MNTGNNVFVTLIVAIFTVGCTGLQAQQPYEIYSGDPIVEAFRDVAIASVSDAVEQVTGESGVMNYDMRPVVGRAVVGRATTTLFKKLPSSADPSESNLSHVLEMIDNADVGEVGVIVVEDGLNATGIGGLMATGAVSRNMGGMIIDGGVRDVDEITGLGLPVFGRSYTPTTAVGRYTTVSHDEPVHCAGVTVRPGDIIVGGIDGVVVVPQQHAAQVLKVAQEIDEREAAMVPYILELKSIKKAVEQFNRL